MNPLDKCPRCAGTLLFDEWGVLRCLLCCREQPGGQDRDNGTPNYVSPLSRVDGVRPDARGRYERLKRGD